MLFVVAGLLILFISFLTALVFLIKELGSRENSDVGIEGSMPIFNEQAVEAVLVEDRPPAHVFQDLNPNEESVELASDAGEFVPFPWELKSSDIEENKATNEGAGDSFIDGPSFSSQGNLYGEISISDLRGK